MNGFLLVAFLVSSPDGGVASSAPVPPVVAPPVVAPPAVAPPVPVPSLLSVGQPVGGMSLADFADKTRPAVVHVKNKGGAGRVQSTGTGFIVAPGLLVTNHHVIEGAAEVDITFDDGTTVTALGLAALRPERDLAVLAIPPRSEYVSLGTSTTLRQGERIIVLGNPQGLAGTLSEGIVSAIREAGVSDDDAFAALKGRIIQITAPISPGSSGSPVFDRGGKVVGVATAHRDGGQNLNFAVPVEEVVRLLTEALSDARAGKAAAPFTAANWVNWVVSAAFFILLGGLLWLAGRTRKTKGKPSVSRIH